MNDFKSFSVLLIIDDYMRCSAPIPGNEKDPIKQIVNYVCFAFGNIDRVSIAKHIKKNKEVKFGEIRYEFNLNNNSLFQHLKKLETAHIVSKKENGKYKLGVLGETTLDAFDKLVKNCYQFLESNPEYI